MNIDILKARKKELGLTNRQLAEISGVSLGTINKIFSGATRYPQLDTMDALISALGLDSLQYHPDSHADRLCESIPAYTVSPKNGHYTLDDYYALPDRIHAELIDGYLIFQDPPTIRHQAIIGELFFQIYSYIREKKGPCKVLLSPIDVRLDNDNKTMLEPDLIIVCDQKRIEEKRVNGAPDFVAEVVSTSSRKRDYLVKLNKYWTAGVHEYWIIDPAQERVSVYRFKDAEEDFDMKTYGFCDSVPIGIYEDLAIDFTEFEP